MTNMNMGVGEVFVQMFGHTQHTHTLKDNQQVELAINLCFTVFSLAGHNKGKH